MHKMVKVKFDNFCGARSCQKCLSEAGQDSERAVCKVGRVSNKETKKQRNKDRRQDFEAEAKFPGQS